MQNQHDSRPDCKYGDKCFRKNPDHLKQYRHPHDQQPQQQHHQQHHPNQHQPTNHQQHQQPNHQQAQQQHAEKKAKITDHFGGHDHHADAHQPYTGATLAMDTIPMPDADDTLPLDDAHAHESAEHDGHFPATATKKRGRDEDDDDDVDNNNHGAVHHANHNTAGNEQGHAPRHHQQHDGSLSHARKGKIVVVEDLGDSESEEFSAPGTQRWDVVHVDSDVVPSRESFEKLFGLTFGPDVDELYAIAAKLHPSDPAAAFVKPFGVRLVGIFEFLAGKWNGTEVSAMMQHRADWDLPELQTVAIVENAGPASPHLCVFRPDPSELPLGLYSSETDATHFEEVGPVLVPALISWVQRRCKEHRTGNEKAYDLAMLELKEKAADVQAPARKLRKGEVIAQTAVRLPLIVPVVNEIGYRPSGIPNKKLLAECEALFEYERHFFYEYKAAHRATAEKCKENPQYPLMHLAGRKRYVRALSSHLSKYSKIDFFTNLFTIIDIGNDESDFGLCLEIAYGLWAYMGKSWYLTTHAMRLIRLAYTLLGRNRYEETVKAMQPRWFPIEFDA